MKRLLFISLLPLSAFAGAQMVTHHESSISHHVTQTLNGGGGNDGTPFTHDTTVGLNDTGLLNSNFHHTGTGSSVAFTGYGDSTNNLDLIAQTYTVDLTANLIVNAQLNSSGFVNIGSLTLDRMEVHLDNVTPINLAWTFTGLGGALDLYDSSFNTILHADLSHDGSLSTSLAAGDYILLGSVEQDYLASGLYTTGSNESKLGTLSYQASLGAVPEPSAFAALGLGAVALLKRRRG